jgi:hypothetical protein
MEKIMKHPVYVVSVGKLVNFNILIKNTLISLF